MFGAGVSREGNDEVTHLRAVCCKAFEIEASADKSIRDSAMSLEHSFRVFVTIGKESPATNVDDHAVSLRTWGGSRRSGKSGPGLAAFGGRLTWKGQRV